MEDYWDHTHAAGMEKEDWGLDFRDNMTVVKTAFGQYSTELFTTRAERIISEHDVNKPLFLYLPHQAVHSGNPITPLEAPWKYTQNFSNIKNKQRRLFAGMVSALDDSIGNVTRALQMKGILNNTVIVFTTDNGGPAAGFDFNMACNWPLRGIKHSLWEGGVRGNGFVWSPLLEASGYVSNHLMQILDWFPTLLSVAGYNESKLPDSVEGFDFWHTLSTNQQSSPRTEMLHNIDPIKNYSALRIHNYKLHLGEYKDGWNGWYKPGEKNKEINYTNLDSFTTYFSGNISTNKNGDEHLPLKWINMSHSYNYDNDIENESIKQKWRLSERQKFPSEVHHILKAIGRQPKSLKPVIVHCGMKPKNSSSNCDFKKPCLYDVIKDPCEYNNIADLMPDVVKKMMDRLQQYNATAVPPKNKHPDPKGLPGRHGYVWVPWITL